MKSPRFLKRLRKVHHHMDSSHRKKQWLRKLRRVMYPHNNRRKRSTKSENPTSSFPDFDDYILTEILRRLPWKSLSGAKCVSKHWCNLIESPEFFRQRRLGKPEQETVLGLFYQHRVGNGSYRLSAWEKLPVNFAPITSRLASAVDEEDEEEMRMTGLSCLDTKLSFLPCKPVYIHGSQHGLILCSRSKFNVEFYVCNPITNQFVVVPEPETHIRCKRIGLFVDKASGQFKIVRISVIPYFFITQRVSRNKIIRVHVYSSVTNKWRVINTKLSHDLQYFSIVNNSTQAVQMGESLYWLDRGGATVAFDIGEEHLRVMAVPDIFYWRGTPAYACLGAPGDVLRYVSTDGEWSIRVKELQLDGTWVTMQVEKVPLLLVRLCPHTQGWDLMNKRRKVLVNRYGKRHSNHLIPIGFHNADPDLVFFYLTGRILSYHFGTRKVELLTSFNLDLGLKARSVFPYVLPKVPILGF